MDSHYTIEINDLGKDYRNGMFRKKVQALRGVSFHVEKGQVFGLLGPNGAGKTTLIKILLGIVRRSAGSARLLSYPAGDRRGRRRVGYLPEQLQMGRHQTARTALEYYGKLSGMPYSDIRDRRDDLLELVGLTDRDRESVRGFSKGMQQRLGLAQALLHNPDVLILDEPTDGLDPVGRSRIRGILQEIREQGRTVFLNSHLLQEVELICDRVAILDKGRLRFEGTIDDLTPSEETTLQIELQGEKAVIQSALHPYVAEQLKPLSGNRFALRVAVIDQAQADSLIDRLRAQGVSIISLSRSKKTLEDAFLDLIAVQAEVV